MQRVNWRIKLRQPADGLRKYIYRQRLAADRCRSRRSDSRRCAGHTRASERRVLIKVYGPLVGLRARGCHGNGDTAGRETERCCARVAGQAVHIRDIAAYRGQARAAQRQAVATTQDRGRMIEAARRTLNHSPQS